MEKKGNNKKSKNTKQTSKKVQEEKKESDFSSIYEKNSMIFIVVHAKPGSKEDAITAVELDYVGVSV
jgi:hypothetical protein